MNTAVGLHQSDGVFSVPHLLEHFVEIMVLPNTSCWLFVCFLVPWFSWFLFLSVTPPFPSSPTQTTLHFLIRRYYCGSYTVVAMFVCFYCLMFERSDGAVVLALNKSDVSWWWNIFIFWKNVLLNSVLCQDELNAVFFCIQIWPQLHGKQVNVWLLCRETRTPLIRLIEFQKVEVL